MAIFKLNPDELQSVEIKQLKPDTGVVRGAADVALSLGKGALTGVKALSDVAGANNQMSLFAETAREFLDKGISEGAKDQALINQFRTNKAEGKGTMAEVGAAAKNFLESPLDSTAEGLGTIVPAIAGARLGKKAGIDEATAATGTSAAMGAGIIKGEIYDAVEREHLAAGKSPEEAAQLAEEAQAYSGENVDQIALGAGLGAVAGGTGVEKTLLKGAAKEVTKDGIVKTVAKGAAAEALPEAVQGGQERLATNLALNREGFDVDTTAGIAGNAAFEALAGGAGGAAVSAVDHAMSPREKLRQTLLNQEGGALTDAAIKATETGATDVMGATSEVLTTMDTEEGDGDIQAAATALDTGASGHGANNGTGSAGDSVSLLGNAGSEGMAPDAAVPAQSGGRDNATGEADTAKGSLDDAANEAATSSFNDRPEPTDAQKEAGNYKVGRAKIGGLDISIENPAGSVRRSKTDAKDKWETIMQAHYGYIKGVKARAPDKEHVDVYVKPGTDEKFNGNAWVVNQIDPATGKFDEPKIMLGYELKEDAIKGYKQNYSADWAGIGDVQPVPMAELRELLQDPEAFKKPFNITFHLMRKAARLKREQAGEPPFVPTEKEQSAPSTEPVELYQWMRNKEGGQEAGNQQSIYPLTKELYQRHVMDKVINKPPFEHYVQKYKDVTHISIIHRADGETVLDGIGSLEELRPKEDSGWSKRVDSFDSQEATEHGKTADSEVVAADPYAGKWFGSQEKADAFLAKKNAAGTHEVVQAGKMRFEIKPKAAAKPAEQDQPTDSNDAKPAEAPQQPEAAPSDGVIARVGITPKTALPVTIKDGIIHMGDEPAYDYENGDPVKADGATFADVKRVLMESGAISSREKVYIPIAGSKAPEALQTEPAKEAPAAVESTAPEHATVGVDNRELGEIVEEFNNAQESTVEDGDKVTHVFDAPVKGEIIRLEDKVRVFNKDHGWMTVAEAKERVAEWKAHAAAQGKDDKTRSANSDRIVLSLFDLTGKWSQPWEEAGYQVYRFDIQTEEMNEVNGEEINVGDVNNFGHEFFADLFGNFDGKDVYAVLAACPCTDFAVSGAKHFAAKDKDGRTVASVKLVHQTLATIEHFKPAVWAIENPVGRIEKLGSLPPWRLSFNPNHIGDPYTKKTLLWGRFNADLPIAPVEPTEGSKMHQKYGGKSLATKNARSATPEGFAYGFFMANNAADHPAMAIANKYDRLDRSLIEQAIKAGVTEQQINEAVEDYYYMDLDDAAANDAIRGLLPDAPKPKERTPFEIMRFNMEGKGWEFVGADDPQAYGRKGSTFATYIKNGIKVGVSGSQSLGVNRGTVELYSDMDALTVEAIVVDESKRRQGLASAALGDLLDGADRAGLELFIEPVPLEKGQITKEALTGLYERFGFKATDESGRVLRRKPGEQPAAKPANNLLKAAQESGKLEIISVTDSKPTKRLATVIDNRDTNEGEYIVRGDGHNLARFEIGRNGKPVRLKYFFDSSESRSMVDDTIADFLKSRSAEIDKLFGAEQPKPRRFADNKFFTADEMEAARARIRSKLGTLNSGIDPEMLIDGMKLTLGYIEEGVRDFAAYAKEMTNDFGDKIKPYLLSFWESARAFPGASIDGMTSAEESAKLHKELITPEVVELVKDVVGDNSHAMKPRKKPKKEATDGIAMQLKQDWGTPHIDGWTEIEGGKNQGSDYGLIGGVKDAFLADAKKYLTTVAKLLEVDGYEPFTDRKGKPEKPVSVNKAGTAVSGDVYLYMRRGNVGVSVHIGASAIRGLSGNHPQGISIMARVNPRANLDKHGGSNIWLDASLSASDLANELANRAAGYIRSEADNYVKTDAPTQERDNANAIQTQDISGADEAADNAVGTDGDSPGESLDVGLAGGNEGADAAPAVRDGIQESAGARAERPVGSSGQQTPDADRDSSAGRPQARTTDSVEEDFTINADELGKGGLGQKYRDNIAAIKIIKAVEAEGRKATAEERRQLSKYVGWGALKGVFDKANKSWAKQHEELRELLTDEEWASARASVLNAHYTSPVVVNAMYEAVERLGFKGGRVLEPSMGSGNFFGLMPKSLRGSTKLHGVELDNLTSRLARALYPNAVIAASTGFQDYDVPAGYFDLAIGNPPFGSEPIVDRERNPYSGFSIHNYFIARMLDKTRDGGLVPVVVSHNFLDALAPKAREWIAQRANLIGAVRLPDTAFLENAGTEVVTDILFFQKTASPEKNPAWVNSSSIELQNKSGETVSVNVNDYFTANPRNVLGKPSAAGTMYGPDQYTVKPDGRNLEDSLVGFINDLPANIYQSVERPAEELNSADSTVPDGIKPGSYYVTASGEVRQRGNDVAGMKVSTPWVHRNEGELRRMKGMIKLRDVLRDQMRLERSDATADAIEKNRTLLNKLYDAFVKENGYINSQTNRRIFMDDTESALVQALEFDFDSGVSKAKAASSGLEEKKPSATKADILQRRVLFPPAETLNVNNAKDALLASLNMKGRLDVDYMANVYDKPKDVIVKELGDLVYQTPEGDWQQSDEYLSGDVKTKLEEAELAAQESPDLRRNVEALKKVIPADKMPSEIFASPGAGWIPIDVYEAFYKEITGAENVDVAYLSATAQWITGLNGRSDIGKMQSEYGTDKLNSFEIFTLLMNGRAVEVKKRIPDASTSAGFRYVTDEEATEAARQRMDKIKALWESWIWGDAERAERLAGIFNKKHNRTVNRPFDGAHLTFPGMSPVLQLRPHQKDMVWRGLQERNVLLDHVVGAGKTFAMIASVMEMRRLGIARKPVFAVPNHLTLQWKSDFSRAYPAANVLAATPEDFSKDNRERMFSKIVTGDYDAIVVGHSSLKKLGLAPEIESSMYQEQIDEIADAIEVLKRERGDRGIVRDMEKIKANLEAKVKDLINKAGTRDKVVTFDELGIDALFVDEMHEFKNLFFTTQKQRVSGLGNPKGSGKAFDLFMKVRWMQQTMGENVPFITATGTPVSNSLSEMFTMQRFMRYDELKRDGLHLFDAWSKMYGEDEAVYEVAPSGVGYRISQRFAKFKNLPSLMGHYRSFADVVTLQDLKDQAAAAGKRFPVPKIRGGRQRNIVARRSTLQRDFFGIPVIRKDEDGNIVYELDPATVKGIEQNADGRYVVEYSGGMFTAASPEEADDLIVEKSLSPMLDIDPHSIVGQFNNLKELTRQTKGKINALSLTGLANKAGLDYRLIDPDAPDFPDSKINLAIKEMVSLYREWTKDRGTQLVFCDLSVPLSARSAAASKEKRLYVMNDQRELTHKKGTLHTVTGREGFPYYLVREGKGASASITVYEPVTGGKLRSNFADKKAATEWVTSFIESEANRDRWFELRDRFEPITPERIAEYRDEQELEVAEDGSNEISMDDLEAIAGASQFSVYDDIKAKLIASGIPEREIAFIHDYNTPKQKQELFKAVNRGDIRFLFGSTPKLGAGTNVQERLVGLHHIDAPWRPSDLEQREGRIIRQGNKLYERDPDGFDVFIGRYATEQTYDTRRWQLLEHKAAGIEQLRKYSGEVEIEDVSSEAANAADMKAAASGNPLILEETQLRTERKRLEALQKAHVDGKYNLQRKLSHARRSLDTYLPEKIALIDEQLAAVKAHPLPKDKDAIPSIVVDGRKASSKEQAESMIGLLSVKVRESGDQGMMKHIEYRGVQFTLSPGGFKGWLNIDSPIGGMSGYTAKDNISPAGMITRFNNFIDSLESRKKDVLADIEETKSDIASIEGVVNGEFEDTAALEQVKQRHGEIQRALMKANQLDAVPAAEREAFNAELAQRKKMLASQGYAEAVKRAASEDDAPAYSRSGSYGSMSVAQVRNIAERIAGSWTNGPEIVVINDMADPRVPDEVRMDNAALSRNTKNQPAAFYYRQKAYLIASQIRSEKHAAEALLHETFGHYGLRGTFGFGTKAGTELNRILKEIAVVRGKEVREKAIAYGLDPTKERDRLIAAEELLSDMAQKNPQLGFVRRAIAAIRTWLRDNVEFFRDLELTDDEIIRNILDPARQFVQRGGVEPTTDMVPAFSRDELPISEAKFYSNYYQHIDIRGRKNGNAVDNAKAIAEDGFKSSFSNAIPIPMPNQTKSIVGEAYTPSAGDYVYLIPRGQVKNGKIVSGWKPSVHEIIRIERDGQTLYDAYLKTFSRDDQTETEAFKRWFGDSKVVDEQGRPLVVYHGTPNAADIEEFIAPADGVPGRHPSSDLGIFFTTSPDSAAMFAGQFSPAIIPTYLSIQNPYAMTWGEFRRKFAPNNARYAEPGDVEWDAVTERVYALREELEQAGHDGILVKRSKTSADPEGMADTWVAFRPEQIKSAIGNIGTFDQSNPDIRYSRVEGEPGTGDTYVTAALKYLAREPEFFQTPESSSRDVYAIAMDIDPGFRVEKLGMSMTKERKADRAWEVFVPGSAYRAGVIMTNENDVWVDLQYLREGVDRGNRIYAVAAAYAHNNNKVLIGDPLGLSRTALYRRTESMLSSALKYGTTRHLEPHVAQEIPHEYYTGADSEWGKKQPGIDWKKGDDTHNIKQLIYTSYRNAINNVPEIKDVIYDIETQQFQYTDGRPYTSEDSERIAAELSRSGNPYRAGSATLKRAALFNTFLRKEGREEGRRLLGRLVDQLSRGGLAPALHEVMYSRSGAPTAGQPPAGNQSNLFDQWDDLTDESVLGFKMDSIIHALQDKHIDLKRVTQNITKAAGEIADRWNAYLQEELFHGRSTKRVKDFIKDELEPLIEDMRARGVAMADFEEFLWARHAEERNEQIAKVNPDMPDGGSGMTTQEAREYLDGLDASTLKHYEALAARVDAINRNSRQILVAYGLESEDTVAAWEGAYEHYVPLMREDMDHAFGNGTGQGFSVRGNASKRATGSNRPVVDILANIAQQREKYIIRGEKNRVSTALIGLAKLNPNPGFWKADVVPTITDIGPDGMVRERPDPTYKNHDNIIVARVPNKRGRIVEHFVNFNEHDERAMRMARSLKNLDQDQVGELLGAASVVTRYFASINTQYNPVFGVINILRDVQGAMLNLSTTELAGKQKEVLGQTWAALKGIYADVRARREGKTAEGAWASLWEEFQREGGQTGFRDMYQNARARGEAIEHALDPEWWSKGTLGKVLTGNGFLTVPASYAINGKYGAKPLFEWLSDYNETLENAVRLSAYKVAKAEGMTNQQAASMAKNLTVNFNRKGEMGRQVGALYAFFNASVQGTARLAETMKGPMGKRIAAGGVLLGVMQQFALAWAGFGDDEPPDFVRDRNIIIPIGGGRYITIPMPLGFNVLPAAGRIGAEYMMGGFRDSGKHAAHVFDVVLDMFNPVGHAGLSMQTIAPTAIDPFAALSENRDWTGRPIAKEDFNSLDPTPGHQRAKDTATWFGKMLSEGLNGLTGGTDFKPGAFSPTPDQIDYLVGQVFGGVGREIMKAEQTASSAVTGDILPTYKIPLVGRLYGNASGQSSQASEFYDNVRKMNEHENEIKGLRASGGDVAAYRTDNPEVALVGLSKMSYRTVSNIRKRIRQLKDQGAPREQIEAMEERITLQMRILNDRLRSSAEVE